MYHSIFLETTPHLYGWNDGGNHSHVQVTTLARCVLACLWLGTKTCGAVVEWEKPRMQLCLYQKHLEMVCALTLLLSRTSCWHGNILISCRSSRSKASAFRQTIGQGLQKKRLSSTCKESIWSPTIHLRLGRQGEDHSIGFIGSIWIWNDVITLLTTPQASWP